MAKPTPLASSIEEITRKGDTFEAHTRLWRNTAGWRFLAAQSVAVAFVSGTSGPTQKSEILSRAEVLTDAFSYPAFGLAATVVGAAAYGYSRLRGRRRVATSESRQNTLRRLLGEPVDVIRTPITKGHEPVIRWYGLESSRGEPTAAFVAGRLQKLLDATAGVDVRAFVFSSRLLTDLVDLKSGNFGQVLPSSHYNWTKKVEIKHSAADDEAVVATRRHCESLLAELRKQLGSDVVERLAAVVRAGDARSRIPLAVGRVDLTARAGLLELSRVLTREVRDVATEMVGTSETVRYVDESGIPRTAQSNVVVSVAGDRIRTTHSYQDARGSTHGSQGDGRSLLGATGHSSLESLIEALTQTPPRGRFRDPAARAAGAKVALLLTTRRLLETKRRDIAVSASPGHNRGAGPRVAPLAAESPGTTLFQQMVDEPPRTLPRLRTRGKVKRGSRQTLEYHRRPDVHGWKQRTRAGMWATLVAGSYLLVVPYLVGTVSKYVEVDLNSRYQKGYQQTVARHGIADDYPLEDYISEAAHPLGSNFLSAVDTLRSARDVVDDAALWTIRQAGVSDETIEAVRAWIEERPVGEAPPPPQPGNIFTDQWGDVGIGDVNPTDNSTVFEAKGIGGESTAGFWYTGVNDMAVVGLGNHTYPYKNVGVSFTSSENRQREEVSLPPRPPSDADLRFEVSGTLHRGWFEPDSAAGFRLPIRSGTKVVAISISDAAPDNDTTVPLNVGFDPTTGTYDVSFMPEALKALKEPRLRYWLGSDPGNIPRARGPMRVMDHFADDAFPLEDVMTSEDQARVVRALGLPAEASGTEILAAIRAKDYSFTPVGDAGKKPTQVADPKTARAGDVLATIGEGYGVLPAEVCNSAMVVMMTATGAEFNGRPINAAAGFLDKGDGKLTTLDSHTLPVDDLGNELDPTPSGSDAARKRSAGADLLSTVGPYAPGVAVVVLGSAVLWRRRQRLRTFVSTAIDHHYDAKIDDEIVSDLYVAMTVLGHLQYSRPGSEPPARARQGDDLRELLALQARSVPVPYEVVSEAMSARGIEATPGVRNALRELAKPDSRLVRAVARRSAADARKEVDTGAARRS